MNNCLSNLISTLEIRNIESLSTAPIWDDTNMFQNTLFRHLAGELSTQINGWQLAKMKKSIPDMSLP